MNRYVIALALAGLLPASQAAAGQVYEFSFSNEIGNVSGVITGTIEFDFLQSACDSGTGPASRITITSAPAAIPPNVEGDDATAWSTQALNTFTIVDGEVVDYQFGASEGSPPTFTDNVLCLNNGPFFVVGGVYICGPGEHYFGDAFVQVYHTNGIAGATFTHDADDDGVSDCTDLCPGTVMPEQSVPEVRQLANHWVLGEDGAFHRPDHKGGPDVAYSIADTGGCSCEQIIDLLGLGDGHRKHGCSNSALEEMTILADEATAELSPAP